ncbi:hypothetical protein [Tahibacter sp.]|uniref:hypothetical protein n=1 Tax=Tahibacter sp. TaxID=2056211 RepID=UPI0028C4D262|nr:hypothetical protein [Tahibacter sp.]
MASVTLGESKAPKSINVRTTVEVEKIESIEALPKTSSIHAPSKGKISPETPIASTDALAAKPTRLSFGTALQFIANARATKKNMTMTDASFRSQPTTSDWLPPPISV